MKALTLTQPWASLVALGHKKVETRSWRTNYRGELAIHAAKGYPKSAREFASLEAAVGRLPERIPLSAVVCVVRLVDVQPTAEAAFYLSGLERLLGDYSPGRFAWFLEMVEVFAEPIPATGALGLWEWPGVRGG